MVMGNEIKRYTPVLDDYLRDFGMRRGELEGRRILDAGAGMRQFAVDCVSEGIAGVWSLAKDNQDWRETGRLMREVARQKPESDWLSVHRKVDDQSVVGLFTNLPFRDEAFDLILSRDGVAMVYGGTEEMGEALLEMVRVLKQGGEARIFPAWTDNWPSEQKFVVWSALNRLRGIDGIGVEVKAVTVRIAGLGVGGAMVILYKD